MSEKPTPWSEVVSGLFAILTAISTYLGTQPLTTLFAVLLGAAVTYTVQSRLQRESEKRSRNADYIENYYAPLLVEIQKIQEDVLNNVSAFYDFQNLDNFKTRPQFYTMGKRFRADFANFTDDVIRLPGKTRFNRDRVINLICEKGSSYLNSKPTRIIAFSSDPNNSPIRLRYFHESEGINEPIYNCLLQDKSPTEIIKEKVTNFNEENLTVEFNLWVEDMTTGRKSAELDTKKYSEVRDMLDKLLSEVKGELNRDLSYNSFKVDLAVLRKKAESVSSRLARYIEEYVPIVDI